MGLIKKKFCDIFKIITNKFKTFYIYCKNYGIFENLFSSLMHDVPIYKIQIFTQKKRDNLNRTFGCYCSSNFIED